VSHRSVAPKLLTSSALGHKAHPPDARCSLMLPSVRRPGRADHSPNGPFSGRHARPRSAARPGAGSRGSGKARWGCRREVRCLGIRRSRRGSVGSVTVNHPGIAYAARNERAAPHRPFALPLRPHRDVVHPGAAFFVRAGSPLAGPRVAWASNPRLARVGDPQRAGGHRAARSIAALRSAMAMSRNWAATFS
jgi:hypothetical protein